MKKIIVILVMCICSISANAMSFSIEGKITGLEIGDTLSFGAIGLPGAPGKAAEFDIIIEKQDEFYYRGFHDNITYYIMTYKPVNKPIFQDGRTRLFLLVKDGNTRLLGKSVENIEIQSEIYNEALQEITKLENTLNAERNEYYRKGDAAYTSGDTVKGKEYIDKFNNFYYSVRDKEFTKLQKMRIQYYSDFPSSEYTVLNSLQSARAMPFAESLAKYNKMSEAAQNDYLGKLYKNIIDRLAVFEAGNNAPDFHLKTITGKEISLEDFRGKYVLIYHWELCPGSITIDKDVVELYQKYKAHLEVIGVTRSIEAISSLYEDADENMELMGVKLKSVLKNMLEHPWLDAERINEENEKIAEDYEIVGMPFFIFISPEGKMIHRGFQDAFDTARKELKSKFGE
ncbi:MAG: TlpA family protein disulfide reductase [Ignavibacteria bacterium]|nr:TlpA family protein disulfide reductase [Ignavibacteria bacterium]